MSGQNDYLLFQVAKQWVLEAGQKIRKSLEQQDALHVTYKTNESDLVTNMDEEIEAFFTNHIKQYYPGHRILGEEGIGDDISDEKGTIWFIDPIDGTMNFVHQKRHFAISLAVYRDGEGVFGLIYDVMADELFHCLVGNGAYLNDQRLPPLPSVHLSRGIVAINASWITENKKLDPKVLMPIVQSARGARSYGSAAIELAYVASGRLDMYLSMRLAPWDFGAGKLLVEEVGGRVTNVNGDSIGVLDKTPLIAANVTIYDDVMSTYLKKR